MSLGGLVLLSAVNLKRGSRSEQARFGNYFYFRPHYPLLTTYDMKTDSSLTACFLENREVDFVILRDYTSASMLLCKFMSLPTNQNVIFYVQDLSTFSTKALKYVTLTCKGKETKLIVSTVQRVVDCGTAATE